MTDHPITPPPELVQQWLNEVDEGNIFGEHLANRVAQWGADMELEACCEWGNKNLPVSSVHYLRAARRPKPPSLKEQALKALDAVHSFGNEGDRDTIRRALEQLDD